MGEESGVEFDEHVCAQGRRGPFGKEEGGGSNRKTDRTKEKWGPIGEEGRATATTHNQHNFPSPPPPEIIPLCVITIPSSISQIPFLHILQTFTAKSPIF
jgi:hypothetical protein